MENVIQTKDNEKHVKQSEFILYLVAVFFYTNMTGMVGNYRNAYIVNVLRLSNSHASLYNTLLSLIPFFLNFFIAMYIDGRKVGKKGKFKPLGLYAAVPVGVLLVLSFFTPGILTGSAAGKFVGGLIVKMTGGTLTAELISKTSATLLMIYIVTIGVAYAVFTNFGNSVNMVAIVMTPNMKERDNVLSLRSIVSAVGNSAPLVIVLVIGLIWKDNEGLQYIIGAGLCGVVGVITMLLGMSAVKERVTYTAEKKNPFLGYKDIVTNKYAWSIIASDFLKSFRNISTYLGPFLAAAILGSTSKFLLFGLPTGIGTAVGMLVIKILLKKFNSKVLYIASGVYSVIINTVAFVIGYIYFNRANGIDELTAEHKELVLIKVLQIGFIVALFLIGLQFGASNLLPTMFQADVLEDIELQTGKRLDATLPTVIGVGTMISGTIASALAPKILYGDHSIIHYIQPTDAVPNPEQSLKTKIAMLFFYTVFHGLMMFLAGVPFFFYKLTGQTKEDIHNAVLEQRERTGASQASD